MTTNRNCAEAVAVRLACRITTKKMDFKVSYDFYGGKISVKSAT